MNLELYSYFFQTFSSAVFSQVSIQSVSGSWPRSYICDKQGFSKTAIENARISSSLVSFLTWSFHPSLVEVSVLNNSKINMENVKGELADILKFRPEVAGNFDRHIFPHKPENSDFNSNFFHNSNQDLVVPSVLSCQEILNVTYSITTFKHSLLVFFLIF